MIFSLFFNENIHCEYLLEVLQQGISNETHNMFSWTSKENTSPFWMKKKKVPYLELW